MAAFWEALRGHSVGEERGGDWFTALKEVELRIGTGESVAIIGRNGSGKSTLLQVIAGILRPSGGAVRVRGQVSALLQLGAGFNPEFTGRENIRLNGAMLGLGERAVVERMEDILRFADIGDFIDQPLRTYSSGMRLRLAFAVVTAVDPEILIIDEALSVGDAFFQSRCVRWLEDFVGRGKTFLCVSHDMFMVKRLCSRGIVLDEGGKIFDGPVADAANLYYRLHRKLPTVARTVNRGKAGAKRTIPEALAEGSQWTPVELDIKERTGDGRVTVEAVRTRPDITAGCLVGDWVEVEVELLAHEPMEDVNMGFGFRDRSGQLIGGYHSFYRGEPLSFGEAGERKRVHVELRMQVRPQLYLVVIGVAINATERDWHDLDCLWDCAQVMVTGAEPFWGLTEIPVRGVRTLEREEVEA